YDEIRRDFVATGKLLYVFVHFPLQTIHPFAQKAAEAAECAGENGKFWDMHHQLFLNQRALAEPQLEKYAVGIGLDRGAFSRCMSGSVAAQKVGVDEALG